MMASDKELPVFNTMSELECLDHRIPGTRCLACEDVENNPSILPPDKGRDHRLLLRKRGMLSELPRRRSGSQGRIQAGLCLARRDASLEAGRLYHGDHRADPPGFDPVGPGRGALRKCSRSAKTFSLSTSARRNPTRKDTSKGRSISRCTGSAAATRRSRWTAHWFS